MRNLEQKTRPLSEVLDLTHAPTDFASVESLPSMISGPLESLLRAYGEGIIKMIALPNLSAGTFKKPLPTGLIIRFNPCSPVFTQSQICPGRIVVFRLNNKGSSLLNNESIKDFQRRIQEDLKGYLTKDTQSISFYEAPLPSVSALCPPENPLYVIVKFKARYQTFKKFLGTLAKGLVTAGLLGPLGPIHWNPGQRVLINDSQQPLLQLKDMIQMPIYQDLMGDLDQMTTYLSRSW